MKLYWLLSSEEMRKRLYNISIGLYIFLCKLKHSLFLAFEIYVFTLLMLIFELSIFSDERDISKRLVLINKVFLIYYTYIHMTDNSENIFINK